MTNLVTEKIINALKMGNEQEFSQIINSEEKNYIDWSYKDSNGNNLMHIAASHPFQSKKILVQLYTELYKSGCRCLIEQNSVGMTPIAYCKRDWQTSCLEELRIKEEQARLIREEKEKQEHIKNAPDSIEQEIQMSGRIHPGIYFTPNLALTYANKEGKNPHKKCDVPDQEKELNHPGVQTLSMHERLAISEALVVSNTEDITKAYHSNWMSNSSCNYITVNVGFVVSNKNHDFHKDLSYKRKFIPVRVDDEFYAIYKGAPKQIGTYIDLSGREQINMKNPHSEETFYDYLKDLKVITKIVLALTEELYSSEGTWQNHKVYAIVIDIHSSRDMCGKCEELTYALQQDRSPDSFLGSMEQVLKEEFSYVLPKEKNYSDNMLLPKSHRLHCVTRVSSSFEYNSYHRPAQQVNAEVPYPYKKINGGDSEEKTEAEIEQEGNRNIKKFANSIILHTDASSRTKYNFYNGGGNQQVVNISQTLLTSFKKQTAFGNTVEKVSARAKAQHQLNHSIKPAF